MISLFHYLTLAFEILSPYTKIDSHTRLYNAAASSPSRPREGDSLAISLTNLVFELIIQRNFTFKRG